MNKKVSYKTEETKRIKNEITQIVESLRAVLNFQRNKQLPVVCDPAKQLLEAVEAQNARPSKTWLKK